jgi:hypothetical protein
MPMHGDLSQYLIEIGKRLKESAQAVLACPRLFRNRTDATVKFGYTYQKGRLP